MIKFAGQFLPNYVRVNDLKYSVLAPIEHKTGTIQGRAGVYDFGTEYGYKTFEAEVQLIASGPQDIIKKAREFAKWLLYDELQTLVILDEPDKYYMARVVGDTALDELYSVGQTKITFVVPSGYAEAVSPKVVTKTPTTSDPYISVTNMGSVETYPVVTLTMKKDAESVSVVSDSDFVRIGDMDDIDKVAKPAMTKIFSDDLTTFTGWTNGGVPLENSVSQGTFAVGQGGEGVVQSGGNYGTGDRWHGASAYKALPKQLQDFEVQQRFVFDHSNMMQTGRIEVVLLDTDNLVIGKFGLIDKSLGGFMSKYGLGTVMYGHVGNYDDGFIFTDDLILKPGSGKGKKRKMPTGFDNVGWAYMSLRRKGNKWTLYFADLKENSPTSKHYNPITATYTDSKNRFSTPKLAKIQIHVAKYSVLDPVKTMSLTDLKVYEVNAVTAADKTADLRTGDVIEIDNERGIVTKNGRAYFNGLDPSSDFFPLGPGVNQLAITPPIADVTVEYRERYL